MSLELSGRGVLSVGRLRAGRRGLDRAVRLDNAPMTPVMKTVSVLLGHSNIGITLKHYRPWVKSLQEKLETEVALAW